MAIVYGLASIWSQKKTSTALALEHQFKKQGLRTACLQPIMGQYNVGRYLKNGCYQYSLPLEAAKSRDAFEQWLPEGFDRYILDISMPYSPQGAVFLDLFDGYNEIIRDDKKDKWADHVYQFLKPFHEDSEVMTFWEESHKKKVREIVTEVSSPIDGPCVDKKSVIYHSDKFVFDTFEPRLTFPRSNKNAIAFGAFPGEFWDIFPGLTWVGYDPCKFQQSLQKEKFDIAIIGQCINRDLKFNVKPKNTEIICYQPPVYLEGYESELIDNPCGNLRDIYTTVKEKPVGTPLAKNGSYYSLYNNRFWVYQEYSGPDILYREKNIMYCNGWVLPQYLMKEGLLEV
jgi:hypothetical protein